MNIRIILAIASLLSCLPAFPQGGGYDEKKKTVYDLFKVRSRDRWGVVDANDNLKLSVEYNEPLFQNGKAVITEYGTHRLAGVMDSVGNFTELPPYYVNPIYPFVCDGFLAVRKEPKGKWGFLNMVTGEMLKVQLKDTKGKNDLLKKIGLQGKGLKGTFVFDFVAPFSEGMAAVYSSRTGWRHIDTNGRERLILEGSGPNLFRSSLLKGECVIFSDKGIVVCREAPDHSAGIVRYLDENYEIKDYQAGLAYPYSVGSNDFKLTLNTALQPDKYENFSRGDSVIFIPRRKVVPEKKKVEEKKDSFNFGRDIKVELAKKVVSAGSKGTAAVTVNITNSGKFDSDELHVSVSIKGAKKEWEGVIEKGDTHQVTLYIPAKFSAASISRTVSWTVGTSSSETSGSDNVTIRRYKPARR